MAKPTLTAFRNKLENAKTEEDVKSIFAKHFDISYDTSGHLDLYTPQILFEFKYEKNFSNLKMLASVLAQNLYYARRLKVGITGKCIPPVLCLAAREQAVLLTTADWKDFYADTNGKYDWDLPPSKPDEQLVTDLMHSTPLKKVHIYAFDQDSELKVFSEKLERYLTGQGELLPLDKKLITEDNFEEVFVYWNTVFGEAVRNGFKSSRYFVNDIQAGRTQLIADQGKVYFQVGPEDVRIKKIPAKDYQYFWSLYDKVSNPDTVRGILAKIDRLTDEVDRRKHGEFFTPLPFAHKALDYLEKTLGKRWWESGEYRLWDMACGTGNLQYYLPADAYPYVYLSTLYNEEVEHCSKLFHGATLFQYDYLNDDIGNLFGGDNSDGLQQGLSFNQNFTWKLPEKLCAELTNPKLKWIILINPPFATAQQGGATGANKSDVANTKVRDWMHKQNLGEVSRELFAQFLFRIRREFAGKQAWLGLFSKLKYVNATNDQKFRDTLFRYGFERGFMFSSVNFSGTSRASQFPVGFLLWNLARSQALEEQAITLDVFDNDVQKVALKTLSSEHRDTFLSKWIDRPAGIKKFPPFSAAITVKGGGADVRDRISAGFLGSLMCKGNDLQNQNMTALFSGPYVSAGAHSITPEIFEQSMVVHAVRRLPKAEWHNDRDQFMQPRTSLPDEFITDCVMWGLFSSSNQTAALKDVAYLGETYQVHNHFFPFTVQAVRGWKVSDSDIALQLSGAQDRFVAQWLTKRTLSTEAKALLDAGCVVYQLYFARLNQLRSAKFKIETWDAGWWQIRNALADSHLGAEEMARVKATLKALHEKLLPQLAVYGFLI